jgi:hypothetical protein
MTTRRPILRRALAACVLIAAAIGSVLFWNDGRIDPTHMGANMIAAVIGFGYLHLRWRAQERRALTPRTIKDTFS